jgi:hypothetical protein
LRLLAVRLRASRLLASRLLASRLLAPRRHRSAVLARRVVPIGHEIPLVRAAHRDLATLPTR